jgi:pyruvate decarboxylase
MDAVYNDIAPWAFKDLVDDFGGAEKNAKTFQIKTKDQVDELFKDKQFNASEYLQLVELYVPKMDAPRSLVSTAEASAKTNAKQ